MNWLQIVTSNYIINVGALAWISAQVLKTLFTLVLTRKLVLERLFGAGGMPSSHSALTSSIAIAMARKLGIAAPEFGLALAFAAVVMYDAMGVRRAAGEQAKILNKIVFEFDFPFFQHKRSDREVGEESEPLMTKELKEFLGHTPVEVLGGCLLGILIAVFVPVV